MSNWNPDKPRNYILGCYIVCRKNDINPVMPDGEGGIRMDGYAVIPLEDFEKPEVLQEHIRRAQAHHQRMVNIAIERLIRGSPDDV